MEMRLEFELTQACRWWDAQKKKTQVFRGVFVWQPEPVDVSIWTTSSVTFRLGSSQLRPAETH